jgi:hypothetical protein
MVRPAKVIADRQPDRNEGELSPGDTVAMFDADRHGQFTVTVTFTPPLGSGPLSPRP